MIYQMEHRGISATLEPSDRMGRYGRFSQYGYTARFRIPGKPQQFVSSSLGETACRVKTIAQIDFELNNPR